VSREVEDLNRRLLRARDAMDGAYAEPLDIPAVAAAAHLSRAHFIKAQIARPDQEGRGLSGTHVRRRRERQNKNGAVPEGTAPLLSR